MTTTPTKIGAAGLTDDHHRRWAMGVSSLADIGRELGVSRQSIHEAMRARSWSKTNYAIIHAVPATAEPADASEAVESDDDSRRANNASEERTSAPVIEPVPERISVLSDDQRTAYYKAAGLATFQAGLMILTEAKGILERERGHHTPISLTRLAETVERAGKIMLPFLLEPPGVDGGLTPLRIEVMSDKEADAVQAKFAAAHGQTENVIVNTPTASGTTQPVENPMILRPHIRGPLPDRESFPDWLTAAARGQGKRAVRDLARALGADVGYAASVDEIIAAILYRAGGCPERIYAVAEVTA